MPARAARRVKKPIFQWGLGFSLVLGLVLGLLLAVLGPVSAPSSASPVDAVACLTAAEEIDAGEKLSVQEREEAHQACLRALSATASVIQKYQFQEADFLITGRRGDP